MKTKKKLIKQYKNNLLGVCNYKKENGDFYVDDFINQQTLIDFLYELKSHENTLTIDGYNFLEEYYGLDHIAEMLLEANSKYPCDNKEDNIQWLKTTRDWAIEK